MSPYRIKIKPLYGTKTLTNIGWVFLAVFFTVLITINPKEITGIAIGALVAFVLFFIPPLLLYFRQLQLTYGVELIIDDDNRILTLKTKHSSLQYKFDDIQTIRKVCSYAAAENRARWAMTDYFFYFGIELTSGKVIIVTCLMVDLYESNIGLLDINNIKPQTTKKLFPTIIYEKSKILNLQ